MGTAVTRHRRPDPFLAAAGTAVVSVSLVVLAVVRGWLGPDVGAASEFCEALRDSVVNQPANTWSNAGFVVAGLAIGWRARSEPGVMRHMAWVYACLVVLLGPGSAAMHASGTDVGRHLDLTSMFLVSSFAAAWALTRYRDWSNARFLVVFAVFLLGSELVFRFGGPIPFLMHAGNAVFAALLVVALVVEVALWRRHRDRAVLRAGLLAVGALLAAFTIWKLEQVAWCDPHSLLQGHAAWHLGCAVAAYGLFEVYRAADRVGS